MFNIYDYINNGTLEKKYEDRTQIKSYCPVCNSTFIISKRKQNKYGQYAYYCSNACSTKDIRDKLGYPLIEKKNVYNPEYQIYVPIANKKEIGDRRIEYARIVNYPELNVETKERYLKLKDITEKKVTIYYPYSHVAQTRRYETYEDNIRVDKKVVPYFSLDNGESFQSGYNDFLFPLFNEQFMDKSKCLDYLWVEGEKNAVECCKRGYLTLSSASATFTEERLKKRLESLFWSIKGLVIIPDLDEAGQLKCKKLEQICWQVGIRTKVLDLLEYQQYDENINDIVDIFESDNEYLKNLTIEDIIYEF